METGIFMPRSPSLRSFPLLRLFDPVHQIFDQIADDEVDQFWILDDVCGVWDHQTEVGLFGDPENLDRGCDESFGGRENDHVMEIDVVDQSEQQAIVVLAQLFGQVHADAGADSVVAHLSGEELPG